MDKELEQAVQTFGMVPEFYQKAFQDAGAEFPDELVKAIKADPNKAEELVSSDKGLMKAVLTIFKSNKDAIAKYIQEQSGSMFKRGGKFDYLMKLQVGGRLTRKQMYEQSSANKGFNRSQANKAYQNARRAGLSRDAAMRAVIGQPAIEETTTTIERPTLINEVSTPVGQVIASQETISARPTRNYDNVDFGSFNFSDAFNKARGYGLNEFTWNGNRYATNLAIPALGLDGKNYSIADTLLQTGNISAPDWWIAKQWEPATVLSGNGVNPWPAIHAREIHPPLKREGGKLSKENEANKKYIEASEKAGQEASKKMTDLKNKHTAELKRVRKGQEGTIIGLNDKSIKSRIPFVTSDGTVVDPTNIESLAKFYNVPFTRIDSNYPAGYAVQRKITVYPNGQRDTIGLFEPANMSSGQRVELERGRNILDIQREALRNGFNKIGIYKANKK